MQSTQIFLSKAIEGFLLWMSCSEYSPRTQDIYAIHLRQLRTFLGADLLLNDLDETHIQRFFTWFANDYRTHRFGGGGKPALSTRSNCWCALRCFFKWANETMGAKRLDKSVKPVKKSTESIIQPLTEDEVKRLLQAAEKLRIAIPGRKPYWMRRKTGERDAAIILMMLDTGMRISELCRLRIKDYNAVSGEITILAYGTAKKTHGRVVYLGKVARQALWLYLSRRENSRPDDLIFQDVNGHELSRRAVNQMLHHIGKFVGVKAHPHKFRHTFAIQFLRNGGNIFILKRLLGHKTLQMSERYLQLSNMDSQTAMQVCSPADRWHM